MLVLAKICKPVRFIDILSEGLINFIFNVYYKNNVSALMELNWASLPAFVIELFVF